MLCLCQLMQGERRNGPLSPMATDQTIDCASMQIGPGIPDGERIRAQQALRRILDGIFGVLGVGVASFAHVPTSPL